MSVRKFQQQDREALISLWKRVFPDDPPHNDPARVISAKLSVDDLIFVSEHEQQIVGACMAGYDGHRGWLYAVAVAPEHRRGGTGTLLVNAALEELKRLGCIKVNLQIRPTNTAVAAFYKSLGFATEDRLSMGAFLH
jgi:ribosomal protein S18 acetylase RimI-like enzyme